MSYEPTRRCVKCKQNRYFGDFPIQGRRFSSWCRMCMNAHPSRSGEQAQAYNRKYSETKKHVKIVSSIRTRAKKLGVAYDLDQYRDQIEARVYAGFCEVTGLPFAFDNRGAQWNSPAIDRIKPESGYVYTNIRVILHALNSAIGHWGEDQAEEVMLAFLEYRRTR